jgi:hypothetical protein
MSVRQVRQLAEGQKSAKVEHHFTLPTPSANQDSWRKGSNFPRKTQIFGFLRHHLAEGVEFPEKNVTLQVVPVVIWRRVPGRIACPDRWRF